MIRLWTYCNRISFRNTHVVPRALIMLETWTIRLPLLGLGILTSTSSTIQLISRRKSIEWLSASVKSSALTQATDCYALHGNSNSWFPAHCETIYFHHSKTSMWSITICNQADSACKLVCENGDKMDIGGKFLDLYKLLILTKVPL